MSPSDYPQAGRPQPLVLGSLLGRTLAWAPTQEILYRNERRISYSTFGRRLEQLGAVLQGLGVKPGDRVGILDHDSHRYLECFFAVPMIGAVLHTVNVRLTAEQMLYTVNHAGDKTLLVHTDFLPWIESVAGRLTTVETVIVIEDNAAAPAVLSLPIAGEYESLLAQVTTPFDFPDLDENSVATLFYTTGTTGNPKGVFFTHRQLVLHTLGAGLSLAAHSNPVSFRADDVYMPLTPMFHVHAWGVPYLATMFGIKQVYPGRYEPELLLRLIAEQGVTFTHGVPTILQMLLKHPYSSQVDLSRLQMVIGGAALPQGLAQQAADRGIRLVAGYGMSETCPIVAISHLKPGMPTDNPAARLDVLSRTGFPIALVRAGIVDADGKNLPPGPENVGELVLQCPWLTPGYYREPERSAELWRGGNLHTGDLAYRDADGYIRITDRLKDVIKIGGEWISSLELENVLSQHPSVQEVAVVGVPDSKWGEHPLASVVLRDGIAHPVSSKELTGYLRSVIDQGLVHQRALLTEFHIVTTIPRTSVGKIDKKRIRAERKSG